MGRHFRDPAPSSAGDTTQRQSQRWLQTHGSDVRRCSSPAHAVASHMRCRSMPDSRSPRQLPGCHYRFEGHAFSRLAASPRVTAARRRPDPHLLVFSIDEALERLEQMTTIRLRSQSFFGRVRNAVGLGTPPPELHRSRRSDDAGGGPDGAAQNYRGLTRFCSFSRRWSAKRSCVAAIPPGSPGADSFHVRRDRVSVEI